MSNAKAARFLSSREAVESAPAADTPAERLRAALRSRRLFPLSSVTSFTRTTSADARALVEALVSAGEAEVVARSDRGDEPYLSLPSAGIAPR